MTKKDFIALADAIRAHNTICKNAKAGSDRFKENHLMILANFCEDQNPRFNRQRWLDYIAGKVGPSGGKR